MASPIAKELEEHAVDIDTLAFMKVLGKIEADGKTMMNKTRIQLYQRNPFWASILARIPMRLVPVTSPIRTAATDGRSIYLNPLFMFEIGEEGRQFVLAHEILHLLNLTFSRKHSRDHKLWNAATDYANNQILVDAGFVMPSTDQIRKVVKEMDDTFGVDPEALKRVREKLTDNFKEDDLPVGLLEPKFKGWTAEEIYEELVEDQGSGEKPKYELGSGGLDEHIIIDDSNMTSEERQAVQDILAQAKVQCKDPGKLPAGLRRYFDDLGEAKVNWRDELALIAQSFEMSDYSWSPPDPGMFAVGITMPYFEYERKLRIRIGIDTSGSISENDIKNVMAEILSISRNFPNFHAVIFCCDTQVSGEAEYDKQTVGDLMAYEVTGGGGTMFRPVLEKFEEDPDVDFCVFFTDGYGEGWCPEFEGRIKNMVWLINRPSGGASDPNPPTWGKTIWYNQYE